MLGFEEKEKLVFVVLKPTGYYFARVCGPKQYISGATSIVTSSPVVVFLVQQASSLPPPSDFVLLRNHSKTVKDGIEKRVE